MMQDLHLHTDFSDGKNTIEEMAEAAVSCGLREICFTDHVREGSDWWPDYFKTCRIAAKKYASVLQISCGVEAKVCDFHGTLDKPSNLDKRIFQVAALHRLPDGKGGFLRKDELLKYGQFAVDCWFSAMTGLRENLEISRIAHPFSLLPFMDISMDSEFWKRVMNIMDAGSYLIECNVKYDNSFVPQEFWMYFSERVVTGSDSHSVEDFRNIHHMNLKSAGNKND